MTTNIDTIEDLIRILDANPEWLEALRSRLLTRELLDMPRTLALFMEATNKRLDRLEETLAAFIETTNRRFEQTERRLDQVDRRLDQIERRLDQIDNRLDQVDRRLDQIDNRLNQVDRRFEQVDGHLKRLDDKVGLLLGAHARNQALREIPIAIVELGLGECRRLLEIAEIVSLSVDADTTGISSGDLSSFRRADAIADAVDRHGDPCYVAVEISYTADDRDTGRAIRNADYMTRFTGRRAHAAVLAVQIDHRVSDVIESGSVSWYKLDPQVLESE